jgi:aspartyl-tRNA(Asn)/glutamyl-tRNA(Gln) amidotransferase subunit A
MSVASFEKALAIATAVNAGRSAREAVTLSLQRAAQDPHNAIIRVHEAYALQRADAVDAQIRAGEHLPLAGVPVVVKDNILVRGLAATAGSKILNGFTAPYTATAVARLEAAGAIVTATTNMDEFAMGSSNETSAFGPVRNPHDPSRIPGGSSGGSAAAVAAGIAPLALGSDTGGSIRQPASLCGVVGIKPTYGAVSRYGLIAYGSSLDQIGPMAQDVDDAAVALRVMAGKDALDSTSAEHDVVSIDAWRGQADPRAALKGLRVGYAPAHEEGLAPAVKTRLDAAKAALTNAGATLVPVSLPHERYALSTYYVLATGEAASNLSRFDGIRYGHRSPSATTLSDIYAQSRAEGFGTEVQRRIMLGTYVLSSGYYDAYYKKAQKVRRKICDDYATAFTTCDLILGPVSPTTAFKLGEKLSDPLQMYLSDLFTLATNLAGVPGISVPFGQDSEGLPVGMQLQAPQWADGTLLRAAAGLATLAE